MFFAYFVFAVLPAFDPISNPFEIVFLRYLHPDWLYTYYVEWLEIYPS